MFNLKKEYKKSYSQCGEDIIVDLVLTAIGIEKPSYLDIGAHEPVKLNNTYYFYKKGGKGVNVEPDPFLFKKIASKRRHDINLNVGIAANTGYLDFYIMTSRTLNTFSKNTAEQYESYGNKKIEKKIVIKVINITEIIKNYFDTVPDFISLDTEGLEMEILKSFDFDNFRPAVFCIETLTYSEDKTEKKIVEILDFMCSKGYFVFADTYINTIFVDKEVWKNRK